MLPGDGSLPGVKGSLPTATVLNVTPFRTAAKGHFDQFPPTGPRVGRRFSQGTFAGTHGNGRDAPEAVVGTIELENAGSPCSSHLRAPADVGLVPWARRGEIDQLSMLYVVPFLSPGERLKI